ncbi:probable chitinase 2 [Rhagoletis pomonella]|uniref:probable chitinase 2 n=1 Tax=Rhagoletis pomonella TaxID=28610 RepID=UPI001784D913|nr:probable chitinase 2 [Rhagoletis pomonella]XP_036337877.1 probable chitinase 2 [Rhagoletis pomonella]XP_036337878.1 probable chitinase 2 [Rhagoletis pomonella]XP_036337879.1 probable chitinase 2 [Rhagoletis pomonella]
MASTGWRVVLTISALASIVNWASAKTGPTHGKVVVCYISTWAVYRPGNGAYAIDNFDPNLCTHVVYAFAGLDITQSAIKSLDPWQDLKEDYGKGGFEHLTGFKITHPHLKVSLAIGGWNEGSKNYSLLVADAEQRGRFVKQVTTFIRRYNFDGLDLDWEYPTQRGGRPQDRENFVQFTKELRDEFDKYNLLLTSAIGAAKNVIDQAYDVRQISRYLDYLHIMCYDYHGSWDKQVGFNAPLTAPEGDTLSVQYTIDYLLKLGAPPNKIVLGLPFYGRTFRTPRDGNVGDPTDGIAFQGPFTREEGFLGYNEICSILSNRTSGWSTVWDAKTSQMLARSERDVFSGLVQVVTFDNGRSIANKVKYAVEKKLAGTMIWSIDTDDFRGVCKPEDDIYADYKYLQSNGHAIMPKRINSNYPLLRTINEATTLALEEIEQSIEDNEIPHGNIEDRKNSNGGAEVLLQTGLLAFNAFFFCLFYIEF